MLVQQGDIAAPALAEGEIRARHHARRAGALADDLRNPVVGGGGGHFGVEVEHQHGVGPGLREQFLPLVEGGEAEGWGVGLEKAHRMRIESGDDGGPPLGAGPGQRLAHHGLMAAMKAIEIAQRDDRAAQFGRNGLTGIEANHLGHAYRPRVSVTKAKPGLVPCAACSSRATSRHSGPSGGR